MSNESWVCSCGTENTGNFCSKCGKARQVITDVDGKVEDYSEQYLKLQIRQQEILNEQEERRIAMQQEKEKKQQEYEQKMKEYNEKISEVPVKVLKQWAGSWLVLVLSICATVSAVCSLVSLFTNISSGAFSLLTAVIKTLLNVLVCIGFWRSFSMAKKKELLLNSGGVRMLKGVVRFYQVIAIIICVLVIVAFIMIFVATKSVADEITGAAGSQGVDLSEENSSLTGVLIAVMIVLMVAITIVFVFFSKAIGFSKEVVSAMDSKTTATTGKMGLAVMFFIVGGITLLGAIGTVAATNFISGLFAQLGDIGSKLGSLGLFGKVDIGDMLSQIANAGMYIFGGILALKFSGLPDEAVRQRSAIAKPVKE